MLGLRVFPLRATLVHLAVRRGSHPHSIDISEQPSLHVTALPELWDPWFTAENVGLCELRRRNVTKGPGSFVRRGVWQKRNGFPLPVNHRGNLASRECRREASLRRVHLCQYRFALAFPSLSENVLGLHIVLRACC